MHKSIWITVLSFAILPAFASADDDWKEEWRHRGRFGGAPVWSGGHSYWGGQFQQRAPIYGRSPFVGGYGNYWRPRFAPPQRAYPPYGPPRWRGDWDEDDYEDWQEEWEERREDQREEYEDWLEERRERLEELRERQREFYEDWD